jgi:2-polyprenyl-6-hydroxyphenyl methylase / 3-demethylubiquinone-9 3-methyltransferase
MAMSDIQTQNIDQAEINKFEELASRWWDPDSEFKPLHEINPLRLNFINQRSPLMGKNILDVGCGGGLLSEGMAQLGATVTGIDMGTAPLSVAKLHLLESGQEVDYQQSTAEAFAENNAQEFDIVTCLEMLEHVPDPSSVVNACARLVKPGGHVYFSTINRKPKAWLFAVVGAEYLLNLLPKGTHDYKKFIQPSELVAWGRESNLLFKESTGLHYNPLTKVYTLAPGLDVNYMLHTQDASQSS